MEVWGGNHAVDNGVIMPGLDAWVYSQLYERVTGGGDVHYVSSCATGRVMRILLADVAGHGDGASTLAQLREVILPDIDRQADADDVTIMALRCNGMAVKGSLYTGLVARST